MRRSRKLAVVLLVADMEAELKLKGNIPTKDFNEMCQRADIEKEAGMLGYLGPCYSSKCN